jgi:hypothetical protein
MNTTFNTPQPRELFNEAAQHITKSAHVTLTASEKAAGCVLLVLPADSIDVAGTVVAVCEPAVSWQWLPLGMMVVLNKYWEDEFAAYTASLVGRIVAVGGEALNLHNISEICSGQEMVSGASIRQAWIVRRAVTVPVGA